MFTNKVKFYDRYHGENSTFFKVITENNFTYFYLVPVIKLATSKFNGKEKTIDVGCGVGTLAFYLASKGIDTRGFDISQRAIHICKEYQRFSGFKNISFLRRNVEELNERGKYDLIICTEIIEHLENDSKFLRKLSTLAKRKGKLVISTPSQRAPLLKLGLLRKFDEDVGHLRRYIKNTLIDLLDRNGFQTVKTWEVERILRNSLYTFPRLGILIKVIRGPLVTIFHWLDAASVKFFGESDIIILAQKK